jgi:plastocyanin domain-containing protein
MVMMAVLTGCASQPTADKPSMGAKPMEASSQGTAGGGMAGDMTCAMCNKGAPSPVKGTATMENGVQVVNIMLKDGYYSPNEITIKAGMPAKLVFAGESKDCSGKPKIAELDKQADFTQTGEATMDLGTVKAGTYKITCGMDSAGGNLVVE